MSKDAIGSVLMGPLDKLEKLKNDVEKLARMAVAFSGGVDSTFLLKVAYDVLKEDVIAITARSVVFPQREFNEAMDFVRDLGVRHVLVDAGALELENLYNNPEDRCYHCKKEIFKKILETAEAFNIKHVADGSNMDDLGDYRPGMAALRELGILSPLKDAGFTKDDIRVLSRDMGLPTWDKPALACLATRIPYGERITKEKLGMIDKAEQYLIDMGFRQVRVRHHGDIARIEVPTVERSRFFDEELLDKVYGKFKEIGFRYTALDLKGYRTGSMNEGINTK